MDGGGYNANIENDFAALLQQLQQALATKQINPQQVQTFLKQGGGGGGAQLAPTSAPTSALPPAPIQQAQARPPAAVAAPNLSSPSGGGFSIGRQVY
jgi:hypothetical protein